MSNATKTLPCVMAFEISLAGVNKLELITDSHGFSWGDEAAWFSPMLKR